MTTSPSPAANDPTRDRALEPERDAAEAAAQVRRLLNIMAALRNPDGGCPWDLETGFRQHRALHDRGSLRGCRRHRPQRHGRPAGTNWATSCSRPCSTPGWRKKPAYSISPTSPALSPTRWSDAIRMSSARNGSPRSRPSRPRGKSTRRGERDEKSQQSGDAASVLDDVPTALPALPAGAQTRPAHGAGRLRLAGCTVDYRKGDRRTRRVVRGKSAAATKPAPQKSWATCCSPSPRSAAVSVSIRRKPCGRRTGKSSAGSAPSRTGYARTATISPNCPWTRWNATGPRPRRRNGRDSLFVRQRAPPPIAPAGRYRLAFALLLAADFAPFAHVPEVLPVGLGKDVAAGAVGDEIKFFVRHRMDGGLDRLAAGIGNRRRRQAEMNIGVPAVRLFQVLAQQAAAERRLASGQAVNHRRVGLQLHAPAQPVDEDAGDTRPLARLAGFPSPRSMPGSAPRLSSAAAGSNPGPPRPRRALRPWRPACAGSVDRAPRPGQKGRCPAISAPSAGFRVIGPVNSATCRTRSSTCQVVRPSGTVRRRSTVRPAMIIPSASRWLTAGRKAVFARLDPAVGAEDLRPYPEQGGMPDNAGFLHLPDHPVHADAFRHVDGRGGLQRPPVW